MNWKQVSKDPLPLPNNPRYTKRGLGFAVVFLVFALGGFTDSIYLTAKHYSGGPIPCAIFTGCDTVTTSAYSMFLGIPVALLGALYYFGVLALTLMYLDKPVVTRLRRAAILTPLGFLASFYFTFLQFFILHAFCFYCLVSALFSTILFGAGMIVFALRHRVHESEGNP